MKEVHDIEYAAYWAHSKVMRRLQTHPLGTVAGLATAGYVLARGVPNVAVRAGRVMLTRAVLGQLTDILASVAARELDVENTCHRSSARGDNPGMRGDFHEGAPCTEANC